METGSSFTEELDTDHTEQVTVQPQVMEISHQSIILTCEGFNAAVIEVFFFLNTNESSCFPFVFFECSWKTFSPLQFDVISVLLLCAKIPDFFMVSYFPFKSHDPRCIYRILDSSSTNAPYWILKIAPRNFWRQGWICLSGFLLMSMTAKDWLVSYNSHVSIS